MSDIIFEELKAAKKSVGLIKLNRTKSLNSLTSEMCALMAEQLSKWNQSSEIAVVILHSENEKAFCAGGDVRILREQIIESESTKSFKPIEDFFLNEYFNDYLLTKLNKPVLAWCHGITMGGGMGLMQGASYRVVCENTVLAMPEVSIGLFPDVGSMYWLSRMPTGVGEFLGMTGARFGPHDALELNLADFFIKSDKKNEVFNQIKTTEWSDNDSENHMILQKLLSDNKHAVRFRSTIDRHLQSFLKIKNAENGLDAFHIFTDLSKSSAWVAESLEFLKKGSWLSSQISFEYIKKAKSMDRKTVFKTDFNLALQLCLRNEFVEGVRVRLVDKTESANWTFNHGSLIDSSIIESFFSDPYSHYKKLTYLQNPIHNKLNQLS